ncbi:MAG: hypothetical protein ACTSUE_23870 [Promethearchaeota archaeon]
MATESPMLTRTFGLVPVTREDIIYPATFDKVGKVTRIIVKFGAKLGKEHFNGTSAAAIKRFYMAARKLPGLDDVLLKTGTRERLWRCAAQPAYFAMQEYRRRLEIVPAVLGALHDSNSIKTIRETNFPSKQLLKEIRERLQGHRCPGVA